MYCTNQETDIPAKNPKRKIIVSAIIAFIIIVVGAGILMNISPENKDEKIETAVNEFMEACQAEDSYLFWHSIYPEEIANAVIKKYGRNSPVDGYLNSIEGLTSFEIINKTPMTSEELTNFLRFEYYLNPEGVSSLTDGKFTEFKITEAYCVDVKTYYTRANYVWEEPFAQETIYNDIVYKVNGEWCCIDRY